MIEVTQNEDLQKYKLRVVLETANRHLGLQSKWVNSKWSVDGNYQFKLVLGHTDLLLFTFYSFYVFHSYRNT